MNPRTIAEVRETVKIGGKDVELIYTVTSFEVHQAADERAYAVGGRAETVDSHPVAPAVARRVPTKEEYLRAFEAAGKGKPVAEPVARAVSRATRCLAHVALRFEERGMPRRVARAWVAIAGPPVVAAYSRGLMAKLLWLAQDSDRREARREAFFRGMEEATRAVMEDRLRAEVA